MKIRRKIEKENEKEKRYKFPVFPYNFMIAIILNQANIYIYIF